MLDESTGDDDDVVWVMVVRGKKTSLLLCSIEFTGSIVSFSLLADIGIPPGSEFMFAMELITLGSCGFLLIPPFLRSFMNRFKKLQEGSRLLILALAIWGFVVAVLTFLSAAVASKKFEECRNLTAAGACSRMQAAISISFIVSFATMGSFLLIFLGSVIPRDITVTTYLRGLGRAATLAASRAQTGRVVDHGFESIPLDVVVQTNHMALDQTLEFGSPILPRTASLRASEDSIDTLLKEEREVKLGEDLKGLDAMEII